MLCGCDSVEWLLCCSGDSKGAVRDLREALIIVVMV